MRALGWLALAVALAACEGDALVGAGGECTSSEECAAGLLCNFGVTPHVCAPMDTVGRDMAMAKNDLSAAVTDLAGVDLTGVKPPDMTGQTPPDLTGQTPPDLTPPPPDLTPPPPDLTPPPPPPDLSSTD
jgi:hypothetical protein